MFALSGRASAEEMVLRRVSPGSGAQSGVGNVDCEQDNGGLHLQVDSETKALKLPNNSLYRGRRCEGMCRIQADQSFC